MNPLQLINSSGPDRPLHAASLSAASPRVQLGLGQVNGLGLLLPHGFSLQNSLRELLERLRDSLLLSPLQSVHDSLDALTAALHPRERGPVSLQAAYLGREPLLVSNFALRADPPVLQRLLPEFLPLKGFQEGEPWWSSRLGSILTPERGAFGLSALCEPGALLSAAGSGVLARGAVPFEPPLFRTTSYARQPAETRSAPYEPLHQEKPQPSRNRAALFRRQLVATLRAFLRGVLAKLPQPKQ